ncbi:hypothetical protein Droror1_Dr00023474 [Drosera rotundifolia]
MGNTCVSRLTMDGVFQFAKDVEDSVLAKPPVPAKIVRQESRLSRQVSTVVRQESKVVRQENRLARQESKVVQPNQPSRPEKPTHVKRVSSVGLPTESVLKTGNLKDDYTLGRKLVMKEDVEDVRREVEIVHHLAGHPNVIVIKAAYEDAVSVHFVMELCAGGELFARICHS